MRSITPEEAQTILLVDPPLVITQLPSGIWVDNEGAKVSPKMAEPWVRTNSGGAVYTEREARAMIAAAPAIRVGWGRHGRTMWLGPDYESPSMRAVPIADRLERQAQVAILRGSIPKECQDVLDEYPVFCVRLTLNNAGMVRAQNEDGAPCTGLGATVQEAIAALADALEAMEDEKWSRI